MFDEAELAAGERLDRWYNRGPLRFQLNQRGRDYQ